MNSRQRAKSYLFFRKRELLTEETQKNIDNHTDPLNLVKAILELDSCRLLRKNYNNLIAHKDPFNLAKTLRQLTGVLSTLIRRKMKSTAKYNIVENFKSLSPLNILTIMEVIYKHDDPSNLRYALMEYYQKGLDEDREDIINHVNPLSFVTAMIQFRSKKNHPQFNSYCDMLKKHKNPKIITDILSQLNDFPKEMEPRAFICTIQRYLYKNAGKKISNFVAALNLLHNESMLINDNINLLAKHNEPRDLAKALVKLKKLKISSSRYIDYKEAIREHANPLLLINIFIKFNEKKISLNTKGSLYKNIIISSNPEEYGSDLIINQREILSLMGGENSPRYTFNTTDIVSGVQIVLAQGEHSRTDYTPIENPDRLGYFTYGQHPVDFPQRKIKDHIKDIDEEDGGNQPLSSVNRHDYRQLK